MNGQMKRTKTRKGHRKVGLEGDGPLEMGKRESTGLSDVGSVIWMKGKGVG